MSQRDFPISFWNPSLRKQSQQLEVASHCHGRTVNTVTVSDCHSNTINNFDQNSNIENHCGNGQYRSCQLNLPNLLQTRAIPISYVSLSAGNLAPGPTQKLLEHSSGTTPLPYPYPQKFLVRYCNDTQNSLKFDPRYNPLLIQPEVKPHLPKVPGEPPRKEHVRGEDTANSFSGDFLTQSGED